MDGSVENIKIIQFVDGFCKKIEKLSIYIVYT